MRTKKTTPRQTSDEVSSAAARVLRQLAGSKPIIFSEDGAPLAIVRRDVLEALAGSCVSQDQVKGPMRRGRK